MREEVSTQLDFETAADQAGIEVAVKSLCGADQEGVKI